MNPEAPPRLSGFLACRYGRRRGLRNSLRSDSPHPFSSVFLAPSPPDKGGDFACAFAGLFNPLALRALPLYSLTETQGERRVNSSIAGLFNPSPRRYTPQLSLIFSCATPRNASGHGRERRLNANDFLSLSKKVLVTLIRFICSFFLAARRTNQEAPPRLSSFGACRYGRRRGLRNSLRSDSPRPFSSVFLATSPPDKGGDLIRAFDGLESFC